MKDFLKILLLFIGLIFNLDVFAGSLNFTVTDWENAQTNHYKVIHVSKNSSPAEIKTAYRALALRYYPDRVEEANKEAATKIMSIINASYAVLSDPERRSRYDAGKSDAFTVHVSSDGNPATRKNNQTTRDNYQTTQDHSSALIAEIISKIRTSTKKDAPELHVSFQRKFDFDQHRYMLLTVALAKMQVIANGLDEEVGLAILHALNKELEQKNRMSKDGFLAIGSILLEGVLTGNKNVSDRAVKILTKFFADTILQEYYFGATISPSQFQNWILLISKYDSMTTLGLRRSLNFLRTLNSSTYKKTLEKLKENSKKEVQQVIYEEENPLINRIVNRAVQVIATMSCARAFE